MVGSPGNFSFAPRHIYTDNDTYTIGVTVTDADGEVATETLAPITISNVAPTITQGESKIFNINEGSEVTFLLSATDPSADDELTWSIASAAAAGNDIDFTVRNQLGSHLLANSIDYSIHGTQTSDAARPRTVVHLHGGNVEPQSDGYPDNTFKPGGSDTYHYHNDQESATLWYHDHTIGITRLNNWAGLAGMYWLRDNQELSLNLPTGEYEIPLVLQDRYFNYAGQIVYPSAPWEPSVEGDRAVVNGTVNASAAAGVDIIELGLPFTDPMADGPAIQQGSLRALRAGMTLKRTLDLVAGFREGDRQTPVVLMGYYNPIYSYGVEAFLKDAQAAGVDGLIIVDLPPEEDIELCIPALKAGVNFIRLATPTTDDKRLPAVLTNTSGFVYYVSIAGITGTRAAADQQVQAAVERLRRHTDLPVAVGFGIRTPEQAAKIAGMADAAVVGSALVETVAANLNDDGTPKAGCARALLQQVRALADGVRGAVTQA